MKTFRFLGLCGTSCGAIAIVVLASGCPFNPCFGVDCNDDNVCTTDTCSGGECSNTAIEGCCLTDNDCDQGFCSEAAGNTCVECLTDTNCANGEVCDEGECVTAP